MCQITIKNKLVNEALQQLNQGFLKKNATTMDGTNACIHGGRIFFKNPGAK